MRRSKSLCAIEGAGFVFISKLIDGMFPDYERIIPARSSNAVVVDRHELAQAIARVRAVADGKSVVGLRWSDNSCSCACAIIPKWLKTISATVDGPGRIAVSIDLLGEQLDELIGQRVRLDSDGEPHGPLIVSEVDDPNYLALISPCRWRPENSQTGA